MVLNSKKKDNTETLLYSPWSVGSQWIGNIVTEEKGNEVTAKYSRCNDFTKYKIRDNTETLGYASEVLFSVNMDWTQNEKQYINIVLFPLKGWFSMNMEHG